MVETSVVPLTGSEAGEKLQAAPAGRLLHENPTVRQSRSSAR
jgi:hypothetical protein